MNARLLTLLATALLNGNSFAAALPSADTYWNDRWRGWHFYEDPPPETQAPAEPPTPHAPGKAPELLELERLQKAVEEARAIAIMRPSEDTVRRYMDLEARVVSRASRFADVAQRLAWSHPELDSAQQGRPVNARALEIFERDQIKDRQRQLSELGRDHVLLFFYRGDCPYCHALAPTLQSLEGRSGLRVEAIRLDGPTLPGFSHNRADNGIARTLGVERVPALFLAQPFTGNIHPIGTGLLSEAQLLERLTAPPLPATIPSVLSAVPEENVHE